MVNGHGYLLLLFSVDVIVVVVGLITELKWFYGAHTLCCMKEKRTFNNILYIFLRDCI